jgi:hypothetical protein
MDSTLRSVERLASFKDMPQICPYSGVIAAGLGFTYDKATNRLKCMICGVKDIVMTNNDDSNVFKHDVVTCDFFRHEYMSQRANRYRTFGKRWPKTAKVTPNDLADNGFYYNVSYIDENLLAKEDTVQCIHCDLKLHSWVEGDTVRGEHLRYNPLCPSFSNMRTILQYDNMTL